MKGPAWVTASGPELVEAWNDGRLSEVIEERSAIYMWKRNLQYGTLFGTDPDELVEWLARVLEIPIGVISNRQLGHFLHASRLELRPASMTDRHKSILRSWLEKEKNRQWTVHYLSQLAQHAPALYVGETGKLCTRTAQHLGRQTDFGMSIEHVFAWEHLDLHYFGLGGSSDSENHLRKAIEYVTNMLTVGGYTQRPG